MHFKSFVNMIVPFIFGRLVRVNWEQTGKSRLTVSKTPDAAALRGRLGYLERVVRVFKADEVFRKWLRTGNEHLENESPLDLIRKGEWQVMADFVDDMLTGALSYAGPAGNNKRTGERTRPPRFHCSTLLHRQARVRLEEAGQLKCCPFLEGGGIYGKGLVIWTTLIC